jgi:ubiquinone biosynthesis protein COQ4
MPQSLDKILRAARALGAYVTIVRDPNKLEKVFDLRNAIAEPRVLVAMADFFRKDERGRRALAERPRIGKLHLAELAALPKGSLGHAFGRHMIDAGLDPSAIPTLPSNDEKEFMDAHLYETHDIWHVMTGFGTDVAGELGLQAFYAAQFPARLAIAILSGGLLNTLVDPQGMADADRRMDAITRGWTMGRAAKPFFGYRWAESWQRPLVDVQRELGVVPIARATEHEIVAAAA